MQPKTLLGKIKAINFDIIMIMHHPNDITLKLGATISANYNFAAGRIIAGEDDYHKFLSINESQFSWWSYTLKTDIGSPADMWIANVPGLGAHFFMSANRIHRPSDAVCSENLSGRAEIRSRDLQPDGSIRQSESISSLHCWCASGGRIYSKEVFDDKVLRFVGEPFSVAVPDLARLVPAS